MDQIKWIIAPNTITDIKSSELRTLLMNRCNTSKIHMEDIDEESEGEPENRETFTALSSGSLPFTQSNN